MWYNRKVDFAVPLEDVLKKLIDLIKKNPQVYWFFGFLFVGSFYFLTQYLPVERHVIHLAIDDSIPFLPIFILPYYLWYIYVPLPMIFLCFKDRAAFRRGCITLFGGMFLSCIFFLIYPTSIDFRANAEGEGILLWLTRFIYSHDAPANVLPSLHCLEATAAHLAVFVGCPFYRRKIGWHIASLVGLILICLSTIFVKQHSAIDLVTGVLVPVVIFLAVMLAERLIRKKKEAKAANGEAN